MPNNGVLFINNLPDSRYCFRLHAFFNRSIFLIDFFSGVHIKINIIEGEEIPGNKIECA